MEQLLWTYDDIVRFINHPDRPLRRWALERLTHLFLPQAAEPLVALLDDEEKYISHQAAEFLLKTDEGKSYAPVLLERLKRARGVHFSHLANALAGLEYRQALPVVLERLHQDEEQLEANELLNLIEVLQRFGGDEAQQALWEMLNQFSEDKFPADLIARAFLGIAPPEGVEAVLRLYRSWAPASQYRSVLEAFALASSSGAGRLVHEMDYVVKDGLEAALERAEWWLGQRPDLSAVALSELDEAFENQHTGVFDSLLREARRLVEARGDDLAGWRAAWEADQPPVGYRREAVLTLSILEEFAAHPAATADQRLRESALGLALLFQLSVDSDDQARIEAAEDKTEMLLDILTQDRQDVLPGLVDQVAALGPAIVPRLLERLDPHSSGWGMIRIAQVVERLARAYPGSCDAAIPLFIEGINDEQGDYDKEAFSAALEAIGPSAVEFIAPHLRDDDVSRWIYLTGVLGEIPTESAAQAILQWIEEEHVEVEEMHMVSLSDIGSPSAIEPLYALWKPGDKLLAENLLVLCELNGVQKPELDEWRRLVKAEEERLEKIFGGDLMSFLLKEASEEIESEQARPRVRSVGQSKSYSGRKSKTVSKKEHKKRAAHKKANRKKKGK